MSTKPQEIFKVMDVAREARANGDVFIPCFRGDAGIGKSQIVQQWAKDRGLPLIDFRLALQEAPDLKGFPEVIKDEQGRARTTHALPDYWPNDPEWEGVLFFDEINRGDTSVTNALMQLLTEFKLGDYELPKRTIIVGAINGEGYDVNSMDAALADRMAIFDVSYDAKGFRSFMEAQNFDPAIQAFITSGNWAYKKPEEVGDDGHYVSPRSWSRLNIAKKCNLDDNTHLQIALSVLGKSLGREFHAFCTDERPLYAEDFKGTKAHVKKQLKLLAKHAGKDSNKRRDDLVGITLSSVVEHVKAKGVDTFMDKDLIASIAMEVPSDQALEFIQQYIKAAQTNLEFDQFVGIDYILKDKPELKEYIEQRLKGKLDE